MPLAGLEAETRSRACRSSRPTRRCHAICRVAWTAYVSRLRQCRSAPPSRAALSIELFSYLRFLRRRTRAANQQSGLGGYRAQHPHCRRAIRSTPCASLALGAMGQHSCTIPRVHQIAQPHPGIIRHQPLQTAIMAPDAAGCEGDPRSMASAPGHGNARG
jgi:hypothetical protein